MISQLLFAGASSLALLFSFSSLSGQHIRAQKCGFGELGLSLSKQSGPQNRDLDFLDESIVSPSGEFRIHFTRTGTHAVVGADVTGTPEFVQEAAIAADSAYTILVGELGFLPPLPDGNIDGPELDIYIKNWGGSYYGMTYFGDSAPSPTYLVVDNDYAETSYSTSGLNALRVTIAHEFFHMVQLRYAYPFDPVSSNVFWYEISSVWMEEKCYPEINDYHAYVADNFRQANFPDLNDASFGFAFSYGHGLFGQVLDQEYGTSNGKHIMLDIWENLSGNEATDNLETVLSSDTWNSSLTDALGNYALYNVFTGSRTIPNQYYPDALELEEVNTMEYPIPIDYTASFDFSLDAFGISFRKFTIPGSNNFYTKGAGLDPDQRAFLTYHSPTVGSSLKSAVEHFWIPCTNVNSADYLIFPLINGNREQSSSFSLEFEPSTIGLEDAIQTLWPNPSTLQNGMIHLNIILSEPGTIKFKIYNILGQAIHQKESFRSEGIYILDVRLPQNTPSGIYFIQLFAGGKVMSRKFTVL